MGPVSLGVFRWVGNNSGERSALSPVSQQDWAKLPTHLGLQSTTWLVALLPLPNCPFPDQTAFNKLAVTETFPQGLLLGEASLSDGSREARNLTVIVKSPDF